MYLTTSQYFSIIVVDLTRSAVFLFLVLDIFGQCLCFTYIELVYNKLSIHTVGLFESSCGYQRHPEESEDLVHGGSNSSPCRPSRGAGKLHGTRGISTVHVIFGIFRILEELYFVNFRYSFIPMS